MRKIITAAAQMGGIQKNEPRDHVVERMIVLLEEQETISRFCGVSGIDSNYVLS